MSVPMYNLILIEESKMYSRDDVSLILPLILFSDDSSANKSKSWNKINNIYFTMAGLDFEFNQKLQNIFSTQH